MKKNIVFICCILWVQIIYSQNIIISGFIKDKESHEPLIGANIYDSKLQIGTVTNSFGYYSISFKRGDSIRLTYSYIGYNDVEFYSLAKSHLNKDVYLRTNNLLKTVEVTASRRIEERTSISMLSIPLKQIKTMPALMGETDIMRSFQLMPGVQGGKEGSSGIYVRGGSPDQNLFLLDDIPLYYVSHIGGFISTFDPNAISHVKLYKGGFPARYGGRLSSVVDIRMKNGNKQKTSGEIAIGTLSMKFSLEGPIKKDSSSYFLSLRRCNIDLVTRILSLYDSNGDAMGGYTFYDLYGKYHKIFKNSDRFYFNFYSGRDNVFTHVDDKSAVPGTNSYKIHNTVKWGNTMASLRYNHIFHPKLFGNLTLAYTQYRYQTKFESEVKEYESNSYRDNSSLMFSSLVNDLILKADFDYYPYSKQKIKFGFSGIYHAFKPGTSYYSNDNLDNNNSNIANPSDIYAYEINAYLEDEFRIAKDLTSNIGLRYSQYMLSGKTFFSFQPRININYLFKDSYSIKASYVQMKQYIHLLSKSGAGMPSDLWIPATKLLKPEESSQVTLGFAHTIAAKFPIELSVEAYYKTMKNLIEYKEVSSFFGNNEDWEDQVETNGKAVVYGIEVLIQKKEGRTTGWIGYSLSKNERTFANINNGHSYPYRYDRRHDFSIVINHEFAENIVFSASWVYQTGNAITLANNHYQIINHDSYSDNGYIFTDVHLYNGRNVYRMPAFHKLDISVSFIKKKKRGIRTWVIGVYNAYSRYNPYYLYYKYDKADEKIKLYQYSLFPIIPSITYSFKF
jgi:outer membrane receptor for ferrienterochelin and colicin